MNKIFYFKKENNYKRLYIFNYKLFKFKRKLNINNKTLTNAIQNIKNNISQLSQSGTKIQPKVNNIILDKLKELRNFYFLHNKGNLGDCIMTNSEFQFLVLIKTRYLY